MIRCTKAIIPVAGYGTRRLPITKTIDKCLLPIGNRPVIDYVVEDCLRAGITDIYFVISKGSTQLQDYYSRNQRLEDYLKANGKQAALELITPPENVNFHYVEQDTSDGRYGTTIPVWLCRQFVEADEHVLVLMGDDFIYHADGASEAARLIAAASETGQSAILGVPVEREQVSRYGVIAEREVDGERVFDHIQEKPTVEEAESNLINVSKYLFHGAFFAELDKSVNRGANQQGEYFITDPINDFMAAGHQLKVVEAAGQYLDSGTLENWLQANQYVVTHPST